MLTPYKLESDAYGYMFLTDSGTRYRIALQDTSESFFPDLLSIKLFDISLICVSNKDQILFDKRIALTISNMVKQLLIDGNIISFFCDISDNRHEHDTDYSVSGLKNIVANIFKKLILNQVMKTRFIIFLCCLIQGTINETL